MILNEKNISNFPNGEDEKNKREQREKYLIARNTLAC